MAKLRGTKHKMGLIWKTNQHSVRGEGGLNGEGADITGQVCVGDVEGKQNKVSVWPNYWSVNSWGEQTGSEGRKGERRKGAQKTWPYPRSWPKFCVNYRFNLMFNKLLKQHAHISISKSFAGKMYKTWMVFSKPLYESTEPKPCLAIHDSELPLLFISIKFIMQLIPVTWVGGGYTVGSVAISQSILCALPCSEPHSGEGWHFMTKCIVHYPTDSVQHVIKCSFAGCSQFLWRGKGVLYEKMRRGGDK